MEEVSIKEGVNYIEVVVVNTLHHNDGLNEETDSFVADNDVSEKALSVSFRQSVRSGCCILKFISPMASLKFKDPPPI